MKSVYIWAGVIVTVLIGLGIVFLVGEKFQELSTRYVVTGDKNYYTNKYEERNGCIFFTDTVENDVKLCGQYAIRERNFNK